jgi:hypothetical protein
MSEQRNITVKERADQWQNEINEKVREITTNRDAKAIVWNGTRTQSICRASEAKIAVERSTIVFEFFYELDLICESLSKTNKKKNIIFKCFESKCRCVVH